MPSFLSSVMLLAQTGFLAGMRSAKTRVGMYSRKLVSLFAGIAQPMARAKVSTPYCSSLAIGTLSLCSVEEISGQHFSMSPLLVIIATINSVVLQKINTKNSNGNDDARSSECKIAILMLLKLVPNKLKLS